MLPIGYADGFDRRLSNKLEVLINGKKAKVVGNICILNIASLTLSEVGRMLSASKVERILPLCFPAIIYATNYGEQSLELINKHNLLSSDGFVIFEHNKGKQFDFFGFELFDQKTYGTMQVSFLKVKND